MKLAETDRFKKVASKDYNYYFDKVNGDFARWGSNYNEDPTEAPAPEILDIEVTTICKGPGGVICPWCYKSNTRKGHNMTLEEFKTIINTFPKNLTQVAFGADAQAESNPDLFAMMDYTRANGVIPNITVADISDEVADNLARVCGAVAVSRYGNKNLCYDSIEKLTSRGMTQVNMHILVSEETYPWLLETLEDYHKDPRLSKMNAVVFLSLKQKGRGESFNKLSQEKFSALIQKAMDLDVPYGFDSCAAAKVARALKGTPVYEKVKHYIESCESTLFSSYINEKGQFFPCSFTEGWDEGGWSEGLNVLEAKDFVKDIWNHERTKAFRKRLQGTVDCNDCRNCPAFDV